MASYNFINTYSKYTYDYIHKNSCNITSTINKTQVPNKTRISETQPVTNTDITKATWTIEELCYRGN